MSNLLQIGTSALLSVQNALATTGHNIANVNTVGYSRQTVEFGTLASQGTGNFYTGSGVGVTQIERSYDNFLTGQVQNLSSSQARYDMLSNLTSRLDNVFADTQGNLNSSLQGFFSALQDVADSPNSQPERQVLLGQANNLVARYENLYGVIQNLNDDINQRIVGVVSEVNGLATSIATLNKHIVTASAAGGTPNDLLDQRDALVTELAKKVNLTTAVQPNGALNVMIGRGQSLVVGEQVTQLAIAVNEFDATRFEIGVVTVAGTSNISRFLGGGEIQGIFDFRERVLLPAQDQLGLVALGLTESFNAQHALGMDLDGNIGQAFFAPLQTTAINNTGNTGSGQPAITIDDVSPLRPENYALSFDGSTWTLARSSDGSSVSGAGPLSLDGMTVDVSSGSANAGDSWLINPARQASANFDMAITDPRRFAAAVPIIATNELDNIGSASLTGLTVDDSSTMPLAADITLTFNPDALGAGIPGFDISGGPGGTIAYDPATEANGKSFSFVADGMSFSMSGVPKSGDQFTIGDNAGGFGDNRNTLALAALQLSRGLSDGNSTFQDVYGGLVASVGIATKEAQTSRAVESSLLQQAQNARDSVSGVNLDEEAANLLRYQQAYQAAAQLVAVGQKIFDVLLNATRR